MIKFLRRLPSWLIGTLGAFAIIFVMAIAQQADAKPVLKAKAGSMESYQDLEKATWFLKFGPIFQDIEETFDNMEVVWSGSYNGKPIVLIAGTGSFMCPRDFRIYRIYDDGPVGAIGGIKAACDPKRVSVAINSGAIHLTFDGRTTRIPLD